MKKYLAILTAIIAVIMSSCSNEDIQIKKTTVIRVDPETVMRNFTWQVNAGDLDGVASDEQLRIRLYVFDEDGNLFLEKVQTVRNYLNSASFELELEDETSYTAVAMTDVTNNTPGNVFEYWEVSGQNQLSTMKVSYLGSEENYGQQEILGISSSRIFSGNNMTIKVEAAGALLLTKILNVHAYSNVSYILAWGNRGNGYYDFLSTGDFTENPNLEVLPDFLGIDVATVGYGSYTYKFLMPQKNYTITVAFFDGNEMLAGNETTGLTLDKGKEYEYEVTLDPYDDGSGTYSTSFKDVTGKTYSTTRVSNEQVEFSPEINKNRSQDLQQSWFIKELL